jgi:hypothetical protein
MAHGNDSYPLRVISHAVDCGPSTLDYSVHDAVDQFTEDLAFGI